jgi:hypothetical protein
MHFLWPLILALSQRLGFDPIEASMNIGLASCAGVLLRSSHVYEMDKKREFREYYFLHNDAAEREKVFLASSRGTKR